MIQISGNYSSVCMVHCSLIDVLCSVGSLYIMLQSGVSVQIDRRWEEISDP
jgi:hypothetical protein